MPGAATASGNRWISMRGRELSRFVQGRGPRQAECLHAIIIVVSSEDKKREDMLVGIKQNPVIWRGLHNGKVHMMSEVSVKPGSSFNIPHACDWVRGWYFYGEVPLCALTVV